MTVYPLQFSFFTFWQLAGHGGDVAAQLPDHVRQVGQLVFSGGLLQKHLEGSAPPYGADHRQASQRPHRKN